MKYFLFTNFLLVILLTIPSPASFEFKNNAGDTVDPTPQSGETQKSSPAGVRTVTVYTLRPEETDDTPCIGAYGNLNLCEISKTVQVCASNEFERGTKLKVGNVECVVLDRMNSRYENRVDLLINNLEEALRFGNKKLEVAVIN
jgi:3D (Asp-Asp-Asp) domain-containing protein